MEKLITNKQVIKYYLARVQGKLKQQDAFHVTEPLFQRGNRISAHTICYVLSYDESSDQSVMLCAPITGRHHQIREHLAGLGHPILNDTEDSDNKSAEEAWVYVKELLKKFKDKKKCAHYVLQEHMNSFLTRSKPVGEFRIDLHAFRYEHVQNDQVIWCYETKNLPNWAVNVGTALINVMQKVREQALQSKKMCQFQD
jgi:23S rRNA-/tRNA-specific pseudouridylate synthase